MELTEKEKEEAMQDAMKEETASETIWKGGIPSIKQVVRQHNDR